MNVLLGIAGYTALVIVGLLVVAGLPLLYVIKQMSKPPENSPEAFVRRGGAAPGSRVVVCLGASIVHGRVCPSFVDLLARRFAGRDYAFVNAGVNGDTSLHVRRRLDRVIACRPDYVAILVGTNDVTASTNPNSWRAYKGEKSLPAPPTLESYRDNLSWIVRQLKERTEARVAVCSLPVMGEDLQSPANEHIRRFNAAIKEVAEQEGAAYLPVYEREEQALSEEAQHSGPQGRAYSGNPSDSLKLGFTGAIQHYLLGRSYDDIAHRRGFLLKTDYIHGNSREAEIIAGEVAAFVEAEAHSSEEQASRASAPTPA